MNTQELFNKINKYLENGIIPKVRVKKYYFEEGLDVGFTCEVHCAIIKVKNFFPIIRFPYLIQ